MIKEKREMVMGNNKPVLVFVELNKNGAPRPISLESITAGKKVADALKCDTIGLIIGADILGAADELSYYGLQIIYVVDDERMAGHQPEYYARALEQVCGKVDPGLVIMGNTYFSTDLAPRIAFKMNMALITDCVGITIEEKELLFTKPVYSSNVMAVFGSVSGPAMATMRSRAEKPAERGGATQSKVELFHVEIDEAVKETEVILKVCEEEKAVRLESADIIVAGGKGIGGPDGFALLKDLSSRLGAALGASRPPCDLGWISGKAQIGQTGCIVAPSLYIAVGISGATQHIAGMMNAKVIVAINKDPEANIFGIADYGVVADYREVLPALKNALTEKCQRPGE